VQDEGYGVRTAGRAGLFVCFSRQVFTLFSMLSFLSIYIVRGVLSYSLCISLSLCLDFNPLRYASNWTTIPIGILTSVVSDSVIWFQLSTDSDFITIAIAKLHICK